MKMHKACLFKAFQIITTSCFNYFTRNKFGNFMVVILQSTKWNNRQGNFNKKFLDPVLNIFLFVRCSCLAARILAVCGSICILGCKGVYPVTTALLHLGIEISRKYPVENPRKGSATADPVGRRRGGGIDVS